MIFCRFTTKARIEIKLSVPKESFDEIQELVRYYRLPLSDVLQALISTERESISLKSKKPHHAVLKM
jgi:hypothetical protein